MAKQTYVLTDEIKANNCVATITKYWQRQHDAGKTLEVIIQRKKRSLPQNDRYWAILQRVSEQIRPLNRQYSKDVWHEHFKREFIGVDPLPSGAYMAKSTTDLDIEVFTNYMTQVEAWAIEAGADLSFLG